MSVISQVTPVASIVRPLIGLGFIATLLMVFKPLLAGVLRAALLVLKPATADVSYAAPNRLQGFIQLNRMARDLDGSQPNLASELRNLAGRDY